MVVITYTIEYVTALVFDLREIVVSGLDPHRRDLAIVVGGEGRGRGRGRGRGIEWAARGRRTG